MVQKQKKWLPFEEAREYVHHLELKNQRAWHAYCKSGQKPATIPTDICSVYKTEWQSWGDWLGTKNRTYLPFAEARVHIHGLGLKSLPEWHAYCKSGQKPATIPSHPERVYKEEWGGWGDWLGTKNRTYLPFAEAREYVHRLGLKTKEEWYAYRKSGQRPATIPSHPWDTYKAEWRGFGDWLGVVNRWTKTALLALLDDLRLHIGVLDEGEIYMLLQQSGALPILTIGTRSRSVHEALEEIREDNGQKTEDAIRGITEEELDAYQEEKINDSDEGEIRNEGQIDTENIFSDLSKLVTPQAMRAVDEMRPPAFGLNEEMAEYLVSNRVNALWEAHINGENEKVAQALRGKGGHYFDEIKRRFTAEIRDVKALPIPDGWAFIDDYGKACRPNLMQIWTAWQIQRKQRIGNWSGVGAGKTLSAILASRVINARLTIIVANSATIEEAEGNGWQKQIMNAYPDSIVHRHEHIKEGLIFDRNHHHYILLNYEKFQREGEHREDLIQTLLGFNPDFIVLDEIHFVKQRYERASKRREALKYLIREASEVNPTLHVLGMSATPVINNLQEAKKLLEFVTGESLSEVGTVPTINNSLILHRSLMLHGLRYRPLHKQEISHIKISEVHNELLRDLQDAQKSILATEQTLLLTKLEIAKSHFQKGTLIYIHYVDGMIIPICRFLENMGLRVGMYTGIDKSGLEPFLNGEVDILLGSSPVGTGLDGLQKVCNRLVMLSLPWTSAAYEQIIGRLLRQGQTRQVDVIIPQVVLEREGETWSWDELRMACIEHKRTLSDCVLDGKIPDMINVNQQEFLKKSREMLEQWIELSFDKLALSAR